MTYIERIVEFREKGLLRRLLIAHDAGWYTHGEAGGGDFKPYTPIFREVLPALKARGFTETELRQLLLDNPREAYTIRVRRTNR